MFVDPLLTLALLLLFLYAHGIAHRLGHALAGRFAGMHVERAPVAERAFHRVRLILAYPLPGRLDGRHTIAVHPAAGDLSRAAWFAIMGGPIADLLTFLLTLSAARYFPSPTLFAASGLAGALFLVNGWPCRIRHLATDGMLLETINHGGAAAGRLAALAALEGAVRNGQLPRSWDRRLLVQATTSPDGSPEAARADLFAYYYALDQGDLDSARAALERLAVADLGRPRCLRALVAVEAQFLEARTGTALIRIPRRRRSRWWHALALLRDQQLALWRRRHAPGPWARTRAAWLHNAGLDAEAVQVARAGIVAIMRHRPDGPTAARHALVEREWLRTFIKNVSGRQHDAPRRDDEPHAEALPLAPRG